MYCMNCGSRMEEGSKFCIACGAKAESNEEKVVAAVGEAEIIVPVQETTVQEAAVSADVTSAMIEEPVQETPKLAQPEPAQQPVQPIQPRNNTGMQQAVSQPVAAQKPEKTTPLPVWKYIGIFLIMGIPILNIVMVFVWAFGSSFNKNTRNYARAILIFFLIFLVLFGVGYFTVWASIQEIFNSLSSGVLQ